MVILRDQRLLLAAFCCLLFEPTSIAAEPGRPTTLRFAVTVNATLAADRPASGRLMVVLGRPDGGEPRLMVGRTGIDGVSILARDLAPLPAGKEAVLDDRSILFPLEHLGALRPGTYAVQAILHTNPDLNLPNAPGDLYSPVTRVRLDPAAGGTVALELSRAIPDETLPADTELVRHVKIRSSLLSEFHGRPIFLRAGVILPRDFAREPDRRYPLRVHIGGYGTRFHRVAERMARDPHSATSGWPTRRRG